MVRDDDGVTLLQGIRDGDCVADLEPNGCSGCGVGGVCGIGGTPWKADNLFNLRASVGLIVRAPRPVACTGNTDSRLADEEGVFVLLPADLPGDLAPPTDDELVWSGVIDGVER